MYNEISWVFILGFLGTIVCFLIMIIKSIKNNKIFSFKLIVITSVFLSMMSLSIGIKLAIINSDDKKRDVPLEYKNSIKDFNKGDFYNSLSELDKSFVKNKDEEMLYQYSIIRLIIFTAEEKSFNYLIDVFTKAAERGKFFYSYDELTKFKNIYGKFYVRSQVKEQQINDNLKFIVNHINDEKMNLKLTLKYKYKDKNVKDLMYFKKSAYPILMEDDIEQCKKQAFSYNISKMTEECIKNDKVNYSKLIYISANVLNTNKHKDTYEMCLKKILEITDEKDEYRKKAEEDLKKMETK